MPAGETIYAALDEACALACLECVSVAVTVEVATVRCVGEREDGMMVDASTSLLETLDASALACESTWAGAPGRRPWPSCMKRFPRQ